MKLHHKILGEGFPLVVIHGLFGCLDNWLSLARIWSVNYKVVLIDVRNHGKSPHSDQMSYTDLVEDLEELCRDLNIEKAHVLGHSMGGKIAMAFALKNVDLVEKLVAVDIAPRKYEPHHDEIFKALERANIYSKTTRAEIETEISKEIEEKSVVQFLMKGVQRDEENHFQWKFNLPVLKTNYLELIQYIPAGIFKKSTLFIRGEYSDYIQIMDWDSITKLFPNADLETIPEAGHWVHADNPIAFSDTLMNFLA